MWSEFFFPYFNCWLELINYNVKLWSKYFKAFIVLIYRSKFSGRHNILALNRKNNSKEKQSILITLLEEEKKIENISLNDIKKFWHKVSRNSLLINGNTINLLIDYILVNRISKFLSFLNRFRFSVQKAISSTSIYRVIRIYVMFFFKRVFDSALIS